MEYPQSTQTSGNAGAGIPPGPGARGPVLPPPPAPGFQQLPHQMFTTAAQLLDLTDKKLVVLLRDGKKWIGILRSWDQFGNILLQNATERIFAGNLMADVGAKTTPDGSAFDLTVIRGENIAILGEIDLDKDDDVPEGYTLASEAQVRELLEKEEEQRKKKEKIKTNRLKKYGFEGDRAEGLV